MSDETNYTHYGRVPAPFTSCKAYVLAHYPDAELKRDPKERSYGWKLTAGPMRIAAGNAGEAWGNAARAMLAERTDSHRRTAYAAGGWLETLQETARKLAPAAGLSPDAEAAHVEILRLIERFRGVAA